MTYPPPPPPPPPPLPPPYSMPLCFSVDNVGGFLPQNPILFNEHYNSQSPFEYAFRPPPPPLPPPRHSSMPLTFSAGNVGGGLPENQFFNKRSNFQYATGPTKRPRNHDNQPPNPALVQPTNLRAIQPVPKLNKGTRNIFFKTKMCMEFLDGKCLDGDNCNFAHGFEDLQKPPSNWRELMGENGKRKREWDVDREIIYRKKLCKWFYQGIKCKYGENCMFLHKSPTDLEIRDKSAITIETGGPMIKQSELQVAGSGTEAKVMLPVPTEARVDDAPCTSAVDGAGLAQVYISKPRKYDGKNKISLIYGDWIGDIDRE